MTRRIMTRLVAGCALLALNVAPTAAHAQAGAWPERTVRIVVPYAPGGTTDVAARQVAARLAESLGKSFIVENKSGASGTIGTAQVAKSAPDGYTFLANDTTYAMLPWLFKSLPWDHGNDLVPVTTLLRSPVVLAVPADSRFGSLRELVDAARAGPGKLTYGSGGVGSSTHLSAEYFESVAGVALTHIPYRGAGDALAGLLGGQIDLLITAAPTAIGQWKNGRLKILAIATPARLPALQDVPTFAQAGVKGYEVYNWFGLAAPRGTPADIVLRLQQEVARALQTTEMRDKMAQQGAEPGGISPVDFASMVRDETRRWGDVVKRAGIKAE